MQSLHEEIGEDNEVSATSDDLSYDNYVNPDPYTNRR